MLFTCLIACTTEYTFLVYFVMHVCILFACLIACITAYASFAYFKMHVCMFSACLIAPITEYTTLAYLLMHVCILFSSRITCIIACLIACIKIYVPCIFCNACLHIVYMSYCMYYDIHVPANFKINDCMCCLMCVACFILSVRPHYTPKFMYACLLSFW